MGNNLITDFPELGKPSRDYPGPSVGPAGLKPHPEYTPELWSCAQKGVCVTLMGAGGASGILSSSGIIFPFPELHPTDGLGKSWSFLGGENITRISFSLGQQQWPLCPVSLQAVPTRIFLPILPLKSHLSYSCSFQRLNSTINWIGDGLGCHLHEVLARCCFSLALSVLNLPTGRRKKKKNKMQKSQECNL